MRNEVKDEEKVVVYTVRDIQAIFKCGINQAYDMMRSNSFPSFRINRSLYVYKDALEDWLKSNKNRDIIL